MQPVHEGRAGALALAVQALLTLALLGGCVARAPGTAPADTGETPDSTPDVTIPDGACLPHASDLDDPERVARLEINIARAKDELGLAGLSVAAHTPAGTWLGASGAASSTEDLATDAVFRIGSVSKTFTAVVVLQLQDEGLLDIDDPLDDWVGGWWDGEGITLRHLLTHTSGIVSYNYVGSFDQSQVYEPLELVRWAKDHGPDPTFAPGTQWEYSNTNFALLGLAVEAATGASYDAELRRRILDPLGMDSTFLAPQEDVWCFQARGFDEGVDVTDLADPSMGWAAGGLISTARDVNVFQRALHGGELLAPETLTEMTTEVVLPDGTPTRYGLGIFSSYDADWGFSYGHTGGISGFSSYMYVVPQLEGSVTVLVNEDARDLDEVVAYIWAAMLDIDF